MTIVQRMAAAHKWGPACAGATAGVRQTELASKAPGSAKRKHTHATNDQAVADILCSLPQIIDKQRTVQANTMPVSSVPRETEDTEHKPPGMNSIVLKRKRTGKAVYQEASSNQKIPHSPRTPVKVHKLLFNLIDLIATNCVTPDILKTMSKMRTLWSVSIRVSPVILGLSGKDYVKLFAKKSCIPQHFGTIIYYLERMLSEPNMRPKNIPDSLMHDIRSILAPHKDRVKFPFSYHFTIEIAQSPCVSTPSLSVLCRDFVFYLSGFCNLELAISPQDMETVVNSVWMNAMRTVYKHRTKTGSFLVQNFEKRSTEISFCIHTSIPAKSLLRYVFEPMCHPSNNWVREYDSIRLSMGPFHVNDLDTRVEIYCVFWDKFTDTQLFDFECVKVDDYQTPCPERPSLGSTSPEMAIIHLTDVELKRATQNLIQDTLYTIREVHKFEGMITMPDSFAIRTLLEAWYPGEFVSNYAYWGSHIKFRPPVHEDSELMEGLVLIYILRLFKEIEENEESFRTVWGETMDHLCLENGHLPRANEVVVKYENESDIGALLEFARTYHSKNIKGFSSEARKKKKEK